MRNDAHKYFEIDLKCEALAPLSIENYGWFNAGKRPGFNG
jgi:hypothetical protein